jgi:glycosyltransferase involved in cell wall biosynthesis
MDKKLLIIGLVWPEPDSTAAGSRMLQLINVFQKDDYKIYFVSTSSKTDRSCDLKELNIETHKIELNDSSFDVLIKQIDPNIVLFDRYFTEEQFGWRIVENCPKAIRILDTEDLHFLRYARHQAFKDKKEVTLNYLVHDKTKREIASIYRCDLSLIISKYEHELLIKTFKIDSGILLYLPFLLENISKTTISSYPSFQERNNFMTIGNFKHEPNISSVLYLKKTIWPIILNKFPKAKLNVYGAYITEKISQMHNEKEGFIIKGSPLQFGAGLKGKLIDAMKYGTPSVTTSIGAEGMHDNLGWNGFIEDSPKEFAKRSIELYKNETIWLDAQKKGISIMNKCFDKEKFGDLLLENISVINKNLANHRLNNFLGAMLQHHTLQSTKYMSKWIEEKNKLDY